MNAPRIALVGYGEIATHHIAVLRHLGAEIVASCNRSPARRQRAREQAGIPVVYDNPLEMLDRERPDGVIVCASVMSQFNVASSVIPAGIPVLLEKPPGTSLAQVEVLTTLADTHRTPVMVGLNRRFYSVYHTALQALGGREAITAVSVEWAEDPARMLALGHPAEILPLLNYANSLHGIDLLGFFAGRAEAMHVFGRDLEDAGEGLRWQMTWQGEGEWGAVVQFASSWDAPGRWRLIVDAPGARLVSAPLESCQLLERGKPAREIEASPEDREFKAGFHGQALCFLDLIRDRIGVQWPACSLEEAGRAMRVAEELTSACTKGKA